MAVLENVKAFYRGFTPPYPKLAGPINLVSQRRTFELSEPATALIEVALEDIEPEWIRAGNCWSIESELGEPIWAGFSEEEEWELDADSITIPLVGPLLGLLSVDINRSVPTRGAAGFTVNKLIEAAQVQGLVAGNINKGPLVEISLGGESVADAIQSLRDQTNLYFRERAVEIPNGIEFQIDFGFLRFPTSTILTRAEIVAGVFTRERFPVSLSLLGPAGTFVERQSTTVSPIFRTDPTRESAPVAGPVFGRGIDGTGGSGLGEIIKKGPGSFTHISAIEERLGGDLQGSAEQRYFDALKGVNEILVTLDATMARSRAPQLGDLVGIRVHQWAGLFGIDVAGAHVHAIEPHEEDGSRDLVLAVHPVNG